MDLIILLRESWTPLKTTSQNWNWRIRSAAFVFHQIGFRLNVEANAMKWKRSSVLRLESHVNAHFIHELIEAFRWATMCAYVERNIFVNLNELNMQLSVYEWEMRRRVMKLLDKIRRTVLRKNKNCGLLKILLMAALASPQIASLLLITYYTVEFLFTSRRFVFLIRVCETCHKLTQNVFIFAPP